MPYTVFRARTAASGSELWITDGTAANTRLLKEILPGTASSDPAYFTQVGNRVFFTAYDSTNGNELWVTDGTPSGTVMVKDIATGTDSSPTDLVRFGSGILFSARNTLGDRELWFSDGTGNGTVQVANLNPTGSSAPNTFQVLSNGVAVFRAYTPDSGIELWRTDGTAAGTYLVKDISSGSNNSSPQWLTAFGNGVLFTASDGTNGIEPWFSDGTAAGTVLLKDINPFGASSSPGPFRVVGGRAFFGATDPTNGYEMWTTDGTSAGTMLVKDINPGVVQGFMDGLAELNGNLILAANSAGANIELWISDGTAAGTILLKDINPGPNPSNPGAMTAMGGKLYFSAYSADAGQELWVTDGTASGTVMVKDIWAGSDNSNPAILGVLGDKLLLRAADGTTGQELWISDGTAAGTMLVADISAGTTNSSPFSFALVPDPPVVPVVSVNTVTANEGNSGSTAFDFTVSLSVATTTTVTVNYATANGTALSGSDYTAASGTLTFAPGETSKTVTVQVTGEAVFEENQTFTLALTSPSGATLGTATGTGTIVNDDAAPVFNLGSAFSIPESQGTLNIFVTRVGLSELAHVISYATANGTATAGSDYTATSGSITYPGGGAATVYFPVEILNDNSNRTQEPSETFAVNITGVTNGGVAGANASVQLNDDDPTELRTSNVTVTEGNSGTSNANVTVTLTRPSSQTVTVNYSTSNGFGGNAALAGSDYAVTGGTLTFAPGETSKVIAVPIIGDTAHESTQTFNLNLSNPTVAFLDFSYASPVITINDNDSRPSFAIGNATVVEGNSGSTTLQYTVTMTGSSEVTPTVNYATANGTAADADSDYIAASGQLSFPLGGGATRTISVTVLGDTRFEADETVFVFLSGAQNATITTSQGTGTIQNDDLPTLSINSVTLAEGNAGTTAFTFTVSLSAASASIVTVSYATADDTATAGSDYTAASDTLTFAPGETTKTVTVNVTGETVYEANQIFRVVLSSPTNATIATGTGTGTITNDDAAPVLTISSVSASEGTQGGGATPFVITVTRTGATELPASATFTVTGSGTNPADAVDFAGGAFPNAGIVTIAASTAATATEIIPLNIEADTTVEPDETFSVTLSAPVNAALGGSSVGTGTIVNDDAPVFSIAAVANSVSEGDTGGPAVLTYDVTLTGTIAANATVGYRVDGAGQSGADGADFAGGVLPTETLTFVPGGPATQRITLSISPDYTIESDDTLTVTLQNPSGAVLGTAQAGGTIVNDDAAGTFSISTTTGTVTEGNSGTTPVTFTVTRTGSGAGVAVDYGASPIRTPNGQGVADAADYAAFGGTLTFAGGVTSQQFTVLVNGDGLYELDEVIGIVLSNPTRGAGVANDDRITIVNDDTAPVLSVAAVSMAEGNAGVARMSFTVTLSAASGDQVNAFWDLRDGTATVADRDFAHSKGIVSFRPGETTQTITVDVNGDTTVEPDETLTLNLGNVTGATFAGGGTTLVGTGTILDDDAPPRRRYLAAEAVAAALRRRSRRSSSRPARSWRHRAPSY